MPKGKNQPPEDLTGKTFGDYYVIGNSDPYVSPKGQVRYRSKVRCIHCGKESIKYNSKIKEAKRQCQCHAMAHTRGKPKESIVRDLSGQRFGRLTVIERMPPTPKSRSVLWICQCDCGNLCVYSSGSITNGNVVSCGCRKKEAQAENFEKLMDNRNNLYVEGTYLPILARGLANSNSKSGLRGISWDKKRRKWDVKLKVHGTVCYNQRFDYIKDAIEARNRAEAEFQYPVLHAYGYEKKDREDG